MSKDIQTNKDEAFTIVARIMQEEIKLRVINEDAKAVKANKAALERHLRAIVAQGADQQILAMDA